MKFNSLLRFLPIKGDPAVKILENLGFACNKASSIKHSRQIFSMLFHRVRSIGISASSDFQPNTKSKTDFIAYSLIENPCRVRISI